jgi:hypothetical protein
MDHAHSHVNVPLQSELHGYLASCLAEFPQSHCPSVPLLSERKSVIIAVICQILGPRIITGIDRTVFLLFHLFPHSLITSSVILRETVGKLALSLRETLAKSDRSPMKAVSGA